MKATRPNTERKSAEKLLNVWIEQGNAAPPKKSTFLQASQGKMIRKKITLRLEANANQASQRELLVPKLMKVFKGHKYVF